MAPRGPFLGLLACVACGPGALGLQCYEGRVHDHDMHSNDGGVTYTDSAVATTCPAGQDACCIKFEAAKCCNIEGRTFAVEDGACASAAMCADYDAHKTMCNQYVQAKHDKCASSTCTTDLCNTLGLFKSGVDAAAPKGGRAPVAALAGAALLARYLL